MKEETIFDYTAFEKEAIEKIKSGVPLEGKDGILAPMIKRLVEASLEGEMETHLTEASIENRRNGKTSKRVKTGFGNVDIVTPRDRNSTFEPKILPKRQTVLGEAIDHKVISMYSKGVSYNDICTHLEELYGLTVSPGTLSTITNRVIDDIKLWQSRPLETVYPFLWLDAIHYKVREDNAIKTKAVYCALGLTREGTKDLLGLYIGENEGARFWLSVLGDLQSRGVKDIFIACVDGLKGFPEAIESIFPQAEVQLCVVHQLRNSLRYVAIKDKKAVMQSLKPIYQAPNKEIAERALNDLDLEWNKKYPAMVKSWLNNWDRLSNYFKYPNEIRRVIYTTNIIESFHSQLRKITKSKRVFSSDMSLLKLLFLVYSNLKISWSGGFAGWKLTMSQLMIIFEDRMCAP
jgi:putative transposase